MKNIPSTASVLSLVDIKRARKIKTARNAVALDMAIKAAKKTDMTRTRSEIKVKRRLDRPVKNVGL